MMSRAWRLQMVLLVQLMACASSGKGGQSSPSNVISRAELDAAGSATVYDAVLRLRPNFLRNRGPTSVMNSTARTVAVVFVNDAEYGNLESLQRFPASRVEEVRYYSGPEATTKFGSSYGTGVIALRMRVQ